MKRSRIHVRRDIIARDGREGSFSAAIGVETLGQRKRFGRQVIIHGPVVFRYQPTKPLSCGAKVWAETFARVEVKRK